MVNSLRSLRTRSAVCAACLAALPNAAAAQVVNLLSNGGFETGSLNGWNGQITGATVVNQGAREGTWVARLTNGQLDQSFSTVVGRTYKATAWIRIESEGGAAYTWGGFVLDASESRNWIFLARSPLLLQSTRGNGWFKIAITFTATTTQSHVLAHYEGPPDRTMVVLVDDVKVFEKGTNLSPTVNASLQPNSYSSLPGSQTFSVTGDDADGAIVNTRWDFGDGDITFAPSGTRSVAIPGAYTAIVTATDDDGGSTSFSLPWSASSATYPSVTINSPATSPVTVVNAALALSGTASSVSVVQITTDRNVVTTATGTTSWNGQIGLQPGWNRVLVQGRDTAGRYATREIRVRYVPQGGLAVSNLQATPSSVARWDPVHITFNVDNSAATHPQFPFDPSLPPGLGWLDGVSVDADCSNDGFQTWLRRPAFLHQLYQRARRNAQEWLYPQGNAMWTVRFAPPETGTWQCRITVREAGATAQSPSVTFTSTEPVDPLNRGPVRVSLTDNRYFEYADGTTFLGNGHGSGSDDRLFSYGLEDYFNTIGTGNETLLRWWIPGELWGTAWWPWNARQLGYNGIVPNTGHSLEAAYGDGLASIKLDAANPYVWQGFMSGFAGLVPGRSYLLRIRWRSQGITGPSSAGQPFGITVKVHSQWTDVGQTASIPALVPHENGTSPWHVSWATFTASGDHIPYVSVILENTTAGAAFIDECAVHEVLNGGALGPQLLRSPKANALYTFDPRRGAGLDAVLLAAMAKGITLKLNISEKQEWLLNRFGAGGYADPLGGNYNNGPGTPTHRLHTYYWRHLFARFGAYRSIHSWELTNEEAPGPGAHFRLTADLARAAAADGNPHLATTSTWATLAEAAWNDAPSSVIPYTDFHAYVRNTGWIDPRDALARDSARLMHEYDLDAAFLSTSSWVRRFSKPTIWGELGIDVAGSTDTEDPGVSNDTQGVWLHKLTWARTGPGGVYPLYWHTNNIDQKNLHGVYGRWTRFMTGIPLSNGRYRDSGASVDNASLRVWGQKDVRDGKAHLWIDNRTHTWYTVVNGPPSTAASGTVTLNLGAPGNYTLSWWNTYTGTFGSAASTTADNAGNVSFQVSTLTTDTAVRIVRDSGPLPTLAPSTPGGLRVW